MCYFGVWWVFWGSEPKTVTRARLVVYTHRAFASHVVASSSCSGTVRWFGESRRPEHTRTDVSRQPYYKYSMYILLYIQASISVGAGDLDLRFVLNTHEQLAYVTSFYQT